MPGIVIGCLIAAAILAIIVVIAILAVYFLVRRKENKVGVNGKEEGDKINMINAEKKDAKPGVHA